MTATTDEIETGPWGVARAEYHRDRLCVSNSALSDFRKSVPLYHGRHVTGAIPAREASEAMNFGTAFHTLVLEPEKLKEEIAVTPEGIDRRTKAGKAAWQEFCAASEGKTVITVDDMLLCHAMLDAVKADSMAYGSLQQDGECERAIRWRDAESGLWIRNLLDKWCPGVGLVIDLKTSSDPSPGGFAKSVANFGYHCQAALYSRGASEVYGMPVEFLFVVVGTEPPHEVGCYLLDAQALELGERLNQDALNELAERRRTNQWGSRFGDRISTLSLPKWATYQG